VEQAITACIEELQKAFRPRIERSWALKAACWR